jgi:hypothetical protein
MCLSGAHGKARLTLIDRGSQHVADSLEYRDLGLDL